MSEQLFNEFETVSAKQWKQKAQADLKGADYNESLLWKTPEGIHVKPFYTSEDLNNDLDFQNYPENWLICQEIYVNDAEKSNKKAHKLLNAGVDSIRFIIPSESIALETLLQNIPSKVNVYFNLEFLSKTFIETLLQYRNTENTFLQIDIIGNLARTGNWYFNLKEDHQILEGILNLDSKASSLNIGLDLYQNAGANMVQQLAYALAHTNEYFNHFQTQLQQRQQVLTFQVAVGSNYFFEIAKLRALRRLYSALASEYGLNETCHILAVPSTRNKTLYDYNTNMLRTTTECMSAILGGANTVLNMDYDAIYHKSNAFGSRISRNQLLVLKHESYFDTVNNPADGAYYIETLTSELAEKGLALFKDIEANGGFLKQLKDGIIQRKIKESAEKEQVRFNAGDLVLLGTNKHPNPQDKMQHE